jgi:hypothetical protein
VFDEAAVALDRIEALAPVLVIAGHGAPFGDVREALARARASLASSVADAEAHFQRCVVGLCAFWLRAEPAMSHERFRHGLTQILTGRGDAVSDEQVSDLSTTLVDMGLASVDTAGVVAGQRLR